MGTKHVKQVPRGFESKKGKAVWKKLKNFWNGYVWVGTWKNVKTGAMWQVCDVFGGKGGQVLYINARGHHRIIKEFPTRREAQAYVLKKVGI